VAIKTLPLDGRFIAYRDTGLKTGNNDIWIKPTSADAKPFPCAATNFDERNAFSTDVRRIAMNGMKRGLRPAGVAHASTERRKVYRRCRRYI
jgi:hypothetical protein